MFTVKLGEGAVFACGVDFRDAGFANISFFADRSGDALLHLSLRQQAGVLVWNRQTGGVWGPEHSWPLPLERRPFPFSLHFLAGRIEIRVAGHQIPLPEAAWTDPAALCAFDLQGGFVPDSFALDWLGQESVTGRGEITLNGPFSLTGWGIDALLGTQRFTLQIAGRTDLAAPGLLSVPGVAAREGAGHDWIGFEADLPGRIWLHTGDPDQITIRLLSNGRPCGAPFILSRQALLARAEALLTADDAGQAARTVMLLAEHVRFAGLWPDLSVAAQARLLQLAAFYRLGAFLWPDGAEAAPHLPEIPLPHPDEQAAEAAQVAFAQDWRAAGGDAAALAGALDRMLEARPHLRPATRRRLFRDLAEVFCSADCFTLLLDRARRDGCADFEPGPEPAQNALILPFMLAQGRSTEVAWQLEALAPAESGWFAVQPFAWVLRQITGGAEGCCPALSAGQRAALVRPALSFLRNRSHDYHGVTGHADLVRSQAALLRDRLHLPKDLAEELEVVTLQVFGLSVDFWHSPDLAPACLSPRMMAASRAFATLHRALSEGGQALDAITQALLFMERHGVADLPRFRREVFPPAGIPPSADQDRAWPARLLHRTAPPLPLSDQLLQANANPDEAVLRLLAFPGTPEPGTADTALMDMSRAAVRRAYTLVPQAPFAAAEARLAQKIRDLLRAEIPDSAISETIFDDIRLLAGPESRSLGFGMAVTLADRLLRAERVRDAADVARVLAEMLTGVPAAEHPGLIWAPALQSALFTLRQQSEGPHQALVQQVLDLFPAAVQVLPPPFRHISALQTPGAGAAGLAGDVVVAIMSCRPNLETRIPALRAAWIDGLKDMGIAHVIVTGGATDGWQMEGDVLQLAAPDDYEGLPQKTLAMIDWLEAQTPFAHVLKIDDDCFLDARELFGMLSHRKFHYYGRVLVRQPGQMDRAWHGGKSASERGRYELDRSPEPSAYTDGGSGYLLNRIGMAILRHRAATPGGRQLIRNSMMEDKLVGDLLALSNVGPEDEGYITSVRRRSHPVAHPVPLWVNGFTPGRASGTALVHLDDHKAQGPAAAARTGRLLRPAKIWPAHLRPQLAYNTNLLELQSPEEKLARLNRAPLAVVAVMRNEMFMLPHFLDHYRKLGVGCFLIADNLSDDGTLEHLMAAPDVVTFSTDSDYRISNYGVAWQQALLSHFRQGRWSLVADADEMLMTPGGARLDHLLARAEFAQADMVRVRMLDIYPKGPLSEVRFASGDLFAETGWVERDPFLTTWPGAGHYGTGPTWTSALRHRLIEGAHAQLFVAQKHALMRYQPWMRFSGGLHYAAGMRLAALELLFAHFKYHAGFRSKAETEVRRGQHFNNAEEYGRYLALMQEGREVIFDPAQSVVWCDCQAVQQILG